MTTSPEQAYDLGEMPSARAVGMGGALNALGVSTTALYLNPANMALARVYHLEALGAYSPEANATTLGLAIVDSVINAAHLSGGVAGTWNEMDPRRAPPRVDRRAGGARAAARRLPRDRRHGAVAARRPGGVRRARSGRASRRTAPSSSPIFNGLTFDLGATASLGDFRTRRSSATT